MGLLSQDQWTALGLLGAGLAKNNFAGGAVAGMQHLDEAPMRQKKMGLLDMQMQSMQSEIDARKLTAQQEQEAIERQRRIQQGLPALYRQPGLTGGQAVPQTFQGTDVPMFSKPAGVAPVQATPGGFDALGALSLGVPVDDIPKYAGLANLGRPKATRQMEVDDGKGGKRIALVDDYGQEVAGFAGYTAPVQVNQGDRVSFVRPAPGVTLPMNQSPDSRASNALGWANHGLSRQRLAMEQGSLVADSGGPSQVGLVKQYGKPAPGYRWKADGSQEAIPGGPADIKAGEMGEKRAKAQESAIAQADSVLGEIAGAKKLVGWNTAGMGGTMQVIPATEARDLSAKLATIKANLGFDRLQQMRDQSPTGGALGQVAVQELAALQATVSSLDQLQSPKQLGQALDKIERHYKTWQSTVKQAAGKNQGGATGGWDGKTKGGASVSNW